MALTINGRGGGVINTPLLSCYIETSFTRLLEKKLVSELVLCTVQKFCVSCSLHSGTNRGRQTRYNTGGQIRGPNRGKNGDLTGPKQGTKPIGPTRRPNRGPIRRPNRGKNRGPNRGKNRGPNRGKNQGPNRGPKRGQRGGQTGDQTEDQTLVSGFKIVVAFCNVNF